MQTACQQQRQRHLEPAGVAQHRTAPRRAAVLVVVGSVHGELRVLLTTRASDLAADPGTIAFPGGHVEATDDGVVAAALREATKEVGLDVASVDVVGVMTPPYLDADDLAVYPVLAWPRGAQRAWSANHAEVDAIAEVSLCALADVTQPTQAGQPSALDRDGSFGSHTPMGDMTRTIIDRLIGGALRYGALAPTTSAANPDRSSTLAATDDRALSLGSLVPVDGAGRPCQAGGGRTDDVTGPPLASVTMRDA